MWESTSARNKLINIISRLRDSIIMIYVILKLEVIQKTAVEILGLC